MRGEVVAVVREVGDGDGENGEGQRGWTWKEAG